MRVVINIHIVHFLSLFTFDFFFLLQAKAEEELQETQCQIDSLLNELSSFDQPGVRGAGSIVAKDVNDTPFSQPEGALMSHTEMLQVGLSRLCRAHFGFLQH